LLSPLIWLPLLGSLMISCWPTPLNPRQTRLGALAIAGLVCVWAVIIVSQFSPGNGELQFQEYLPWIQPLGLTYQLGIDGLSLPLVVLNGLLTGVALYSSDRETARPRLYYALILLLNAGVAGAFLSQNLLLFFLFYEVELLPLYLLIAIWGGARRGYAAMKFLIYTALSGIIILAAFLGLVWFSEADSFAYDALQGSKLPLTAQLILLGALLVGFGIKIPLAPFHTWLPDAHVEASTPISVLLAGVLLKLGTYGLLRFGWGLLPDAWAFLAPWLASWAVVSVLYGSLTAIAQTDMKKMVAYSSIGHMGYVLLAFAASTPVSILGSILQMVSHGLISAQLFLLVGVIYNKTGTRDLTVLRGLLNPERGLPVIGSLMIVGVMASAGLPGMVGFVAEFMTFRGSLVAFPVQTLLSMIGTGLTSVYFLLLVNQAFFGRLALGMEELPRVQWLDRTPGIVLSVLIVILGIVPNWMVHWSEASTDLWTRDRIPQLTASAFVHPSSTTLQLDRP
jgi:NAD(P)H-quinone oxidoreductase subunit 4